jgi:hypothetical protein
MLKSTEILRQAAQKLRESFPGVESWEEVGPAAAGGHSVGLAIKLRLGGVEHVLALEPCSLGHPRFIRSALTKLEEITRHMPGAHPVATAVYIGPQSAGILRSHGLGYIDLSGNCHLAFGNVLIEKEGKRNVRPSTRPLRTLFAPRATRVVRVLLTEPARVWRLEELAKAAEVSLGHSHNVVKRLEEVAWVDRDGQQRIHLAKPADLLDGWCESYRYRQNEVASYFVAERPSRKVMTELARVAQAEGRRYAFTLAAGLSLVAPQLRMPAIHCYLEGDPGVVAAALGVRPATEVQGALHLLTPYDSGVFYGTIEKSGLKVVSLPQLYADLRHYERRGPEQAEHLRREAMGY